MEKVEVCGRNNNFGISEKSNHRTHEGDDYVYPACKFEMDPSKINSYSLFNKTLVVTNEGIATAIGDNSKSQISGSLPKRVLSTFTDMKIRDSHNKECKVLSAVCGNNYAFYIISSIEDESKKGLAYAHANLDKEFPVVLNIRDAIPVSIYGGYSDCAAITSVGSVIYIHNSLWESTSTQIEPFLLPENEKAVSVVCCYNFVFVLSARGRVFISKSEPDLVFSEIPEFKDKKIVSISGIFQHCLAVTDDGKVFVRGGDLSNNGYLGLGKNIKSPDKFKEIKSLNKYKIVAVYAGTNHSLFQTEDGLILGCGDNTYGQLLLSSGPCRQKTYRPVETIVTSAKFCIVGDCSTVIFKNYEPPMNPNKRN